MRITKDQVVGALKLMGLEFQDSEIDMMLRGVNQAISNYESSAQGRRADRHRTCLRISSGLAGPAADQGAATLRHDDSENARHEGAIQSGRRCVLAHRGSGAAAEVARSFFHRSHKDVPGSHAEALAQAALPDHGHGRVGVAAGGDRGSGDPRGALSRAAARHSVRAERPVRHQGHFDHLRRGAVPDARRGQGRDRGGTSAYRGRRTYRRSFRWEPWHRAACGSKG